MATKTKKPAAKKTAVVKAHRGMAHVPRGRRRPLNPRQRPQVEPRRRGDDRPIRAPGIDRPQMPRGRNPRIMTPAMRRRLMEMRRRAQQRRQLQPLQGRKPTPQQQQLLKRQQVAIMKAQLKQQKNISPQRRAEMEAFIKASTPTRAPDQRARFTDRAKLARDRFNKQAQPTPTAPTPSSKPTGINRKKAIQDAQIQYRDMLKKQMEQRNKRQKQNEQRVKATKMTGGSNPNTARQMEQLKKRPTATPATQKTVPTRTPRKPQVDPKARTPQKKRPTGTPIVPQAKPTPKAPTPRRRRFRFRGRR